MPDHLTSLTQHQRDHLIHHTHCGMLVFTDDLLKAVLEGDPAAEKLLGQATGHAFTSFENVHRPLLNFTLSAEPSKCSMYNVTRKTSNAWSEMSGGVSRKS